MRDNGEATGARLGASWLRCVHQHPSARELQRLGRVLAGAPEGEADWSTRLEAYRHRISWLMATLDFAVEEVHTGDPASCYAYTVGLSLFSDPELIVFGLPTEAALPLLTAAAFGAIGRNRSDVPGTADVRGLLEDFEVSIQELPRPEEYLTVAHAMWVEYSTVGEKESFRAVRLVLDKEWGWDMGHGAAAWDSAILPPPSAAGA